MTKNELEAAFVRLLRRHRLPRGELNAALWIRGRFFRPDCLWRRARLMVELDGREVHATDHHYEGDRARDRILLAEGWLTIRITWRQMQSEAEAVAADLRASLSRFDSGARAR